MSWAWNSHPAPAQRHDGNTPAGAGTGGPGPLIPTRPRCPARTSSPARVRHPGAGRGVLVGFPASRWGHGESLDVLQWSGGPPVFAYGLLKSFGGTSRYPKPTAFIAGIAQPRATTISLGPAAPYSHILMAKPAPCVPTGPTTISMGPAAIHGHALIAKTAPCVPTAPITINMGPAAPHGRILMPKPAPCVPTAPWPSPGHLRHPPATCPSTAGTLPAQAKPAAP